VVPGPELLAAPLFAAPLLASPLLPVLVAGALLLPAAAPVVQGVVAVAGASSAHAAARERTAIQAIRARIREV
jgi:hypothetical protein